MNKWRLTIILVVLAGLVGLAVWGWGNALRGASPVVTSSVADPSVHIGGPFSLTDQNGQPRSEKLLEGKWTAVFFGFTYCPDVCPLTLQTLEQARTRLGARGRDLQFVFITIDPERDQPAALKAYLDSQGFPRGVIGLTGTEAQIAEVARAYRATYSKVGDGPDYTLNHTSVIYLMNPEGEFADPLAYGLTPQQMADVISRAMAAHR